MKDTARVYSRWIDKKIHIHIEHYHNIYIYIIFLKLLLLLLILLYLNIHLKNNEVYTLNFFFYILPERKNIIE